MEAAAKDVRVDKLEISGEDGEVVDSVEVTAPESEADQPEAEKTPEETAETAAEDDE